MKRNKAIQIGIGVLIILLSHLGRSIVWNDEGIKFAGEVNYAGIIADLISILEEAEDGDVKAIGFSTDNTVLEHSEKIDLMGEMDFTGLKGDMIIVRKTDNKWVEIGRYLRSE